MSRPATDRPVRLLYLSLHGTAEGQAGWADIDEVIDRLRTRGWDVEFHQPSYVGKRPPGVLPRLAETIWLQLKLASAIARADALYVRVHPLAYPAALIARLAGTPVVQECNGPIDDFFIAYPQARRLRGLIRWAQLTQYRHAAEIIAVTEQLSAWLRTASGHGRVTTIANGANTDLFTPEAAVPDGLPERYAVFFGSLAPWQGIATMLAATRSPRWPSGVALVIAGGGALRDDVEAAAGDGVVAFLGSMPQEQLPGIVAGAVGSLIVKDDPIHAESGLSPLKLFESMAAGTPVVVSDLPGLGDTVRRFDCGEVVPAGDPDEVAAAVARLAEDPTRRERLGANGRTAAVAEYSWDAVADRTAAVIERAIGRGRNGGRMSGQRTRVLVATHLFPTGAGLLQGPWVAEQVDALAAHADVSVLCCSQLAPTSSVVRDSGVRVDFRNIATPLGRGRAGLLASTVRYRRALADHLQQHRGEFDVVHAHFGFPDAVVTRAACRAAGLPYLVTLHGDDAFKVLQRRDPIGSAVRYAVSDAAYTICVSSAMERVVHETLPDVRTTVVPNGFDASRFRVSHASRDLGLLFVGLLVPVKNLDVLLQAYAQRRGDLQVPLTLAGDGPLRAELEALAAGLGIAEHVRFLGEVGRDEVASLMSRAHALVLPSSSEGWPLVVTESLAVGTPVVASRVGGIPEIMRGPECGLLVEPGDIDALGEALVSAVARSWEPDAVASASGARSWAEQAVAIAALYDSAARGGGA